MRIVDYDYFFCLLEEVPEEDPWVVEIITGAGEGAEGVDGNKGGERLGKKPPNIPPRPVKSGGFAITMIAG